MRSITAPGSIGSESPEILVDVEKRENLCAEHMDAIGASTNKLINQSVKDAVDNKLVESGYLTKELLEDETKTRTKVTT